MSRYDDYITRMCRAGAYTPEQARKTAISREVEKNYRENENPETVSSTHTPFGECK